MNAVIVTLCNWLASYWLTYFLVSDYQFPPPYFFHLWLSLSWHYFILIDASYRYLLTAVYLVAIQYYTRIGGKVSVILIKYENNQGEESSSASLVYKVTTSKRGKVVCLIVCSLSRYFEMQVFGLYFMQSYIGLFYHASLHRDILALRQVLIQRLIVAQVCVHVTFFTVGYDGAILSLMIYLMFSAIRKSDWEFNSLPQVQLQKIHRYSVSSAQTICLIVLVPISGPMDECVNFLRSCSKKKHEKESPSGKSVRLSTRVEKEYLKPSYTASIGAELEDGLFDGN